MKFYPDKKGEAKQVLAMLIGGHKRLSGSFCSVG